MLDIMLSLFSTFIISSHFVHSIPLHELTIDDLDIKNLTTASNGMIRNRRFTMEYVEIEGTCLIIKSDPQLPKIKGKCGNKGQCKVRSSIDRYPWNRNIPDKTCLVKEPDSFCLAPSPVIKNVRCLVEDEPFVHRFQRQIACLDSTEPGIDVKQIITQDSDDPIIMDTTHCNQYNEIRNTDW